MMSRSVSNGLFLLALAWRYGNGAAGRLGDGGLGARGAIVVGRDCLLALAASGGDGIRTVFRRRGSRELRDGTLVCLDHTVVFHQQAGSSVAWSSSWWTHPGAGL